MTYLGSTPTTQSFISGTDYFNGTGAQTAFTLTRTVASVNDIQVTVNNVVQQPNSGYTLSGTTLTFDQAPSVGTNNVYVRYLSTTTQAITPSQNTVSWNTLDANTQGDLGISFKNRIINSNMAIDQRNNGASITPINTQYLVDRFSYAATQASKFSAQQNAGSVTPPIGFNNYQGLTVISTQSLGAGDFFGISQSIEGFNISDLGWGTANAKTVTLSFWIRSSLTGTFGGSLRNSVGNRSYPFSYTINAANTWEYKTITIAGDTSGTWLTNNGIGISLFFSLGTGSTFSGAAGAWTGSNFLSATGATSVVGTNGATWYLTGVQLEVGTQATTFTLAGGSYGAELALCQRYFQKYTAMLVSASYSTATTYYNTLLFPVEMRAVPTILYSNFTNMNSGNALTNSVTTKVLRIAAVASGTGSAFSVFDMETSGAEL